MVNRKFLFLLIIYSIIVIIIPRVTYAEIIAIVPHETYYIYALKKFENKLKEKGINIDKIITETDLILSQGQNTFLLTLGSHTTKKFINRNINLFFFMTADITIFDSIVKKTKKKNIAGIFYIADINKRLNIIKNLFPEPCSIALIYSPNSRSYAKMIQQISEEKQIKLSLYLTNYDGFSDTLYKAIRENEIFWMIPDSSLYDYSNIKLTLVTAVKFGKPVITFSPVFLEGGAFLSYKIDTDKYIDQAVKNFYNCYIGRDCNIEFAENFKIIINKNLAKFWKIKIPTDQKNIILK